MYFSLIYFLLIIAQTPRKMISKPRRKMKKYDEYPIRPSEAKPPGGWIKARFIEAFTKSIPCRMPAIPISDIISLNIFTIRDLT
jgi:hypothetical protein